MMQMLLGDEQHSAVVDGSVSEECGLFIDTGISSQIRTKLRDWARAGCYSQAALPSNDSKTL